MTNNQQNTKSDSHVVHSDQSPVDLTGKTIDELINEMCPDGVEWKPLKSITTSIVDGSHNVPPVDLSDDSPVMLSAQNISENHQIDYSFGRQISRSNYEIEAKRVHTQYGDVLLTIVGAIGRTAVIETTEPLAFQRSVCILSPKRNMIDSHFLMYALSKTDIQTFMIANARGAAQKGFYLSQVEKLQVPVPPLPVQERIAELLDKMAELEAKLEAKLEAELEARRQQYEWWRDHLLDFRDVRGGVATGWSQLANLIKATHADTITYEPLATIAEYAKNRIDASQMGNAGYVGVENLRQNKLGRGRISLSPSESKVIEFMKDDILVGNIRPYLKKIWQADASGGTNGDVLVIRIKDTYVDKVNPRFLYHCLSSDSFFHYMMVHAKGAKMPRGNKTSVMTFRVPVPPLHVQSLIVDLLDKLDDYAGRIDSLLPQEIRATRQRYEWWRDKLLDFKDVERITNHKDQVF